MGEQKEEEYKVATSTGCQYSGPSELYRHLVWRLIREQKSRPGLAGKFLRRAGDDFS